MYGDGSLYYDTRNKAFIYSWFGQDGKRHKKNLGRDEKSAKAYVRKARNQNKAAMTCGKTVGEWVLEYIEIYVRPNVESSSYERLLQTAAKISPIASIPLNTLSGEDVQKLINDVSKDFATSTTNKVHGLLKTAYAQAIALELVERNPLVAIKRIQKNDQKQIQIFTFTDLLHLFRTFRKFAHGKNIVYQNSKGQWVANYANMIGHRFKKTFATKEEALEFAKKKYRPNFGNKDFAYYQKIFYLSLVTGCRIGELLALRWENVNLDKREITIKESKRSNTCHPVFKKPKTNHGFREIPIVYIKTVSLLKKLRASAKNNTELVLHTFNGMPYNYNFIRKIWNKVADAAEVRGKTIHVFRHTFCTVALAKGIPLLEVARIAGHKKASTTLSMYGHAIPNYNKKIIEMFSSGGQ